MVNLRPDQQYPFYISDQYLKDISFENLNFLMKYNEKKTQPEVSVNVETEVSKITDNNYNVSMKVIAQSVVENTNIFVLEMEYCALVSTTPDLQNDILEPVLLVHCPFLMFPFVREIIANITRCGGYPPLLVEPIDFAALFIEKKKEIEMQQKSDTHSVN